MTRKELEYKAALELTNWCGNVLVSGREKEEREAEREKMGSWIVVILFSQLIGQGFWIDGGLYFETALRNARV